MWDLAAFLGEQHVELDRLGVRPSALPRLELEPDAGGRVEADDELVGIGVRVAERKAEARRLLNTRRSSVWVTGSSLPVAE